MKDKRKSKIILAVLLVIGIVSVTVGVTYAFFNYTRTGLANTVSTGRIYFNSSQDGRVNLTNIFPIDPTETGIMNDNTKVGTVAITVTGDTSYDSGVEYLVSAVNVNNTVGTGNNQKTIPISISAEASGTLGTSDDDYFEDRDTSTSHIYKVLAKDTISNNDQLMVGYIAKGATGINGTITIKAYIDKNNIAISDTYDGTESDNNGTTTDWVDGRTVFTTTEWNSLSSSGVSFQVRVEANEGIWVIDRDRNDMKKFTSEITSVKSSITEINFIKMSEEEINTHANLIDLTSEGGNGMVKAWIENGKLYVASPGTIYFPENCAGLFYGFINAISINFANINTENVTNMQAMFNNCSKVESLNLSGFDTKNVTNMQAMFSNCSSLTSVDLSHLNTPNLEYMNAMFNNCADLVSINLSGLGSDKLTMINGMFDGCTSLISIDMTNFNFGKMTSFEYLGSNSSTKQTFNNLSSVETISLKNAKGINLSSMRSMFVGCTNLISVDLSDFNIGNVTDMGTMFVSCSRLTTIYVSSDWNVNNVTSSGGMFNGCTSLKGGGTPQTTYDANHVDKEYARIDGGANSSTPGYLTLKNN